MLSNSPLIFSRNTRSPAIFKAVSVDRKQSINQPWLETRDEKEKARRLSPGRAAATSWVHPALSGGLTQNAEIVMFKIICNILSNNYLSKAQFSNFPLCLEGNYLMHFALVILATGSAPLPGRNTAAVPRDGGFLCELRSRTEQESQPELASSR